MTVRTFAYLNASIYQDGQAPGSITPLDMRDFVDTVQSVTVPEITAAPHASSYTLVLADAQTVVEMTSASANNLTVPPNSSVAFNIGTVIEVFQYGAGQVTLVAGAGVTLRSSSTLTLRTQYSTVSIRKRATDEWVISGDVT